MEVLLAPPDTPASGSGAMLETYRGTVYPWHCDHMGHMNVMWYVGKFDEATWQLFTLLGLTPTWLRANGRGMAAVDQRIAYQRELQAGDTVVVRTAMLQVKPKVIRFAHQMFRQDNGEIAAQTLLVAAHLDTNLRKSCPFPDAVVARAEAALTTCELPWAG